MLCDYPSTQGIHTQFSVYVFARSIEGTPFRGLRWITGRKNGLVYETPV